MDQMIRAFTLLSTVAITLAAQAQPTLTFAGNAPVPGSSYTLQFGPYMAPGAAGAGQTWDMSGLASDSSMVIMLVDPADAEGYELFPGATVAETGNEASMFWRATTDGVHLVGSYSSDPEGDLAITYSDEGLYLPYPCTYQTTWTDDMAATFDIQGFTIERSGTIVGEADGYGTLILPDATVPNVLRVHWVETNVDQTELFETTSVFDSYLYYEAGRSYPLVQVVTATINVLGNEVTNQFTQWYGDLSTGIGNGTIEDDLSAWPNPAKEHVTLKLPKGMEGEIFVQFHDATGKAAHNARYISTDGMIRADISGLASGLYTISATDADGGTRVVRLSVQ